MSAPHPPGLGGGQCGGQQRRQRRHRHRQLRLLHPRLACPRHLQHTDAHSQRPAPPAGPRPFLPGLGAHQTDRGKAELHGQDFPLLPYLLQQGHRAKGQIFIAAEPARDRQQQTGSRQEPEALLPGTGVAAEETAAERSQPQRHHQQGHAAAASQRHRGEVRQKEEHTRRPSQDRDRYVDELGQ